MDFDSSSKFISSLAKFLQSLCNGYVEFNSGVEVIGHIYLSVDTGKKIDYILNEKVCKTDENSVTFISNSFHAQPAEKPKPPPKTAQTSDNIKISEPTAKVIDDDDIVIMDEAESKNTGTIPTRDRYHLNSSSHFKATRPSKRSFNQSFPSSHKHSAKHGRSDPSSGPNGAQLDTDSLHSENNTSSNFLPAQLTSETTITAATESDMSHLSQVFPKNFNDTVNNQSTSEEKDIKPQLDSEMKIIQVKQEYDQSGQSGEDNQESFDDSQDHSSVFPGMPYDQYYGDGSRRGQRLDYGHIGGMSQGEFFQVGAGTSGDAAAGDSSGRNPPLSRKRGVPPLMRSYRRLFCPVPTCNTNFQQRIGFTECELKRHWMEKHEEYVKLHHCALCNFVAKRKGNVYRHIRTAHNRDIHSSLGHIDFQPNKEFVPPHPFTLKMALGVEED